MREQETVKSVLEGIRVLELADEQAEYCGMVLAGLGADVVKVEPPGGSPTRRIGPYYGDIEDPERSLFFWQYNRGKRSVVLDLDRLEDGARFEQLLATADVLLESTPTGYLNQRSLGQDVLRRRFPSLVVARVSHFGDVGPWAKFKGTDLIHLALGGVMMNCGYDPRPDGTYDLPPIAPQMWHAYHAVGDQLVIAIMSALLYRWQTGDGQILSAAVHEAVAKIVEGQDLMTWILRRAPFFRQTCRHAGERVSPQTIGHTKDGRWVMMMGAGSARGGDEGLATLLAKYGVASDLKPEHLKEEHQSGGRPIPGTHAPDSAVRVMDEVQRFWRRFVFEEVPWREAQEEHGLQWSPLRKPHENALDEHWRARGTFTDIAHPEIGRTLPYVTSKWISDRMPWIAGRRAPLLNEDAATVFEPPVREHPAVAPVEQRRPAGGRALSRRGKPFLLDGVRVFDFSWFLASAGGTRFLTALGAEVIKVEWKTAPDTRLAAMPPVGGREAREKATGPLPARTDIDMGGQFNNKNPGKRGITLNVRHPKGLEIAKRLIATSDIVAEGFSPGVLERWGLSYDVLRSIKPDIIYARQSGWGARGVYGRLRATGPIAQSFTGLSEMSGLPEPAMPAGWGWSYLDWIGACSFALALVSALYHRARTGEGQMVESSQCEAGLFVAGTAILDWAANGRVWSRYGNRSPYLPAAPHGAFPGDGDDRWVAIGCFTQDEWLALVQVAGHPEWAADPRFATLNDRLRNQDALEAAVGQWTRTLDTYAVMTRLQAAGVPAGVCQTPEDRYDHDPQLAALEWLVEVTGTEIGRWPVYEVPIKMSESPFYSPGRINRGAPGLGEDNAYVYGELLGMSESEMASLRDEGVI
jgi:crotonobetainyl-CoA:carnitine CoA-transferase CaiB-like acyl-CoA transferase